EAAKGGCQRRLRGRNEQVTPVHMGASPTVPRAPAGCGSGPRFRGLDVAQTERLKVRVTSACETVTSANPPRFSLSRYLQVLWYHTAPGSAARLYLHLPQTNVSGSLPFFLSFLRRASRTIG